MATPLFSELLHDSHSPVHHVNGLVVYRSLHNVFIFGSGMASFCLSNRQHSSQRGLRSGNLHQIVFPQ